MNDRVFPSLADRRAWIGQRLARRYKRELACRPWSVDELVELEPSLRGAIERANKLAEDTRLRIRWAATARMDS